QIRLHDLRLGHDRAAALAGAKLLVAVEALVHARDRVLAVVADLDRDFVNLLAAAGAAPEKPVLLAAAALALDDNEPRVVGNPRRMRHAAGTEEHLAGTDHPDLLLPFRREIVQPLLARDLQRHLVARIDMEVGPQLPTAAQKRDRFGILPQHPTSFSGVADAPNRLIDIDGNQVFHKCLPQGAMLVRPKGSIKMTLSFNAGQAQRRLPYMDVRAG